MLLIPLFNLTDSPSKPNNILFSNIFSCSSTNSLMGLSKLDRSCVAYYNEGLMVKRTHL